MTQRILATSLLFDQHGVEVKKIIVLPAVGVGNVIIRLQIAHVRPKTIKAPSAWGLPTTNGLGNVCLRSLDGSLLYAVEFPGNNRFYQQSASTTTWHVNSDGTKLQCWIMGNFFNIHTSACHNVWNTRSDYGTGCILVERFDWLSRQEIHELHWGTEIESICSVRTKWYRLFGDSTGYK